MTSAQPIRFAIVGFGHIGKRHAGHILAHPECGLTAVCDVDARALEAAPDEALRFSSVDEMLDAANATNPDVACICTPNGLHAPHAIACLNAGLHVVVEKPMALSTAECDAMLETAARAGRRIFAVKQNRYNPPVQQVKSLLESGRLGKVLMAQVNCFWNRNHAYYAQSPWRGTRALDGGALFTQFSHFVDILYYLLGPVESATGRVENFLHQHNTEVEDSGAFVLKAASGAVVSFAFTTCSYRQNMEGSITLFAEHGTVKIGGQYLNTIEYQQLEGEALPTINISAKANDYGLYQGSMSNHDLVIGNVVDVLRGRAEMMTTAEEGREVVRIIEGMYGGSRG